jgi:hypothetical protein
MIYIKHKNTVLEIGKRILVPFLVILLAIGPVWAGGKEIKDTNETHLTKAREKASRVKEGDWKSLAECAKMLLDKKICNEEVLIWLKKSISIHPGSFNMTLLGDYYYQARLFREAHETYIEAIRLAQEEHQDQVIHTIQVKMLISLGTQNYLNNLEKSGTL